MNTTNDIEAILSGFKAVGLDQIGDLRLMNRRDVKYVFPFSTLPGLLDALDGEYSVLEVSNIRVQQYETMYFDTKDLSMYQMHRRGKYERHKVRIRKYTDSDKAFLEVKVKDNRGFTEKSRVELHSVEKPVLSGEEEFLTRHAPYDQEQLFPVLRNWFNRITLVKSESKERVTIDFDLRIQLVQNKETVTFPGLAIAEVKVGEAHGKSVILNAFKKFRIKSMRFSKYCFGVAKLRTDVSANQFRRSIRMVEKIQETSLTHST